MNLVTEYPQWFLVFCLILGVGYAFFLYRFDKRTTDFPFSLKWMLGFLRALCVAILAFFLLKPLIRTVDREVELPIMVIAQDNSSSLKIGKDSTFYTQEWPNRLKSLSDDLSAKMKVNTYSFGEKVNKEWSFSYSDKQTDISELLDEIQTRYEDRNLGGVILASDGIYNKGADPVYGVEQLKVPVFSIALGDTNIKRDLILRNVAHNRLAYLGNKFPLEIEIGALQCEGETAQLQVTKNGEVLQEHELTIDDPDFNKILPILVEAKKTGLQQYTVRLTPVDKEVSTVNNTRKVFIDVLDSRQKILILGHAPHPDIRAIRSGIESNDQYDVETALGVSPDDPIESYDLVVLTHLPSPRYRVQDFLSQLEEHEIPTFFMVGAASDFNGLNDARHGVTVPNNREKLNEVRSVVREDFPLFQLSEQARRKFRDLPPLNAPFGEYKMDNSIDLFLEQKIGQVKTEKPLFAFNERDGRKTGVLLGEGIWRWRMNDMAEHGNLEFFNEWVTKTVQYLSAKEDKSYFRVSSANDFKENERIIFKAELYNKSYELVNEPDVNISIQDGKGNEFPFSFSRTSDAYRLDAGRLPVGEYSYSATTEYNGKEYVEKGEFSVSPVQVELANTVADHKVLYDLASKSNGELFRPEELDALSERVLNSDSIKPVSYSQEQLSDLINLKWLFFVLLGLLTLEWGIRKYKGAY